MLHAEAIIVRNAHAERSAMVRQLVAIRGMRSAVKISGILLVGIITVGIYGRAMPSTGGIDETLLDLIVFSAAVVSSIGGFAFSALCGAALFHTQMNHIEVVQTMLISSIGIQVLMIMTIWRSISWLHLCRFLIGGLMGIPLGLFILIHIERHLFASGVGVLLCTYSAYLMLRRPFVVPPRLAYLDLPIGFVGGITGGAVAFPGAPVTAWCQLRGWTRDQQRGIYQPFIFLMQIVSLTLMPLLNKEAGVPALPLSRLYSVPPAFVGAIIGLYIYRKCSDRLFSIVIKSILFVSGLTLLF